MKYFNMKLLLLILLILTPTLLLAETFYYVGIVCASDHSTVTPGPAYDQYDVVSIYVYQYDEGGNTYVIQDYTCSGNGGSYCPGRTCHVTKHQGDNFLDQDFLDASCNMMTNYVVDQVWNYNNISGYQSFNTIYNDVTIYRNITWDVIISENGSIDYTLNIAPMP
jgi:hypothetical protein